MSDSISRPEFDRALNDIDALKMGHVEMRTMLLHQGQVQAEQSGMLKSIQDSIDADNRSRKESEDQRRRDRFMQNKAVKNTIIAANTFGLAVLPFLVAAVQCLLKRWIGQ